MIADAPSILEFIKAIAGLWALGLFVFLILLLVSAVIFFRPQTQVFLGNLKNFRIKRGDTEISINKPATGAAAKEQSTAHINATVAAESAQPAEKKTGTLESQPELRFEPELRPYYFLYQGDLTRAEESFRKLQAETTDAKARIFHEAEYLQVRFEKGDEDAQRKI